MRWLKLISSFSLTFAVAYVFATSGYIQVTSLPNAAVADGHSLINITAVVTDSHGNVLPDGTQVDFESDLGTFRQNLITTQNGRAQAVLQASLIPGTAHITVKVIGFDIQPTQTTVSFVTNRSLLSAANQVIEVMCPAGVEYDPQNHVIEANQDHQKVFMSYRETTILADHAQVNIDTMDVRASNVTLKIDGKQEHFRELIFNLDSLTGQGFANYTGYEFHMKPNGYFFTMGFTPVHVFGHVDINRTKITQAKEKYSDKAFAYEDLSEAPALVKSVQAVVLPHNEIQFVKASLFVGEAHLMSLPLYQLSLQPGAPILMNQIVTVNNNQVAVSYPYYLSLGPRQSTFLRLHMGDQGSSGFGASNGPQLDYEIDWQRGEDSQGGFLLNGLGQSDWGLGAHEYTRIDRNTNLSAQIQLPQIKSFFGSVNLNHQMGAYNLNFLTNVSRTIVGNSLTDQNTEFTLQRNASKIGKLPLEFTYGLTSSLNTTTAPVPIRSQEAYGLTESFTMLPQQLQKGMTFNSAVSVNELAGTNVGGGLGINFSTLLSDALSQHSSVSLGYNYTQDPYQASRLGAQRITGTAYFHNGPTFFQISTGASLGVENVDTSADFGYQFARNWRFDSQYTLAKFISSTFLDYGLTLYYRIGQREVGLTWTEQTNRLGIVVLGSQFN